MQLGQSLGFLDESTASSAWCIRPQFGFSLAYICPGSPPTDNQNIFILRPGSAAGDDRCTHVGTAAAVAAATAVALRAELGAKG